MTTHRLIRYTAVVLFLCVLAMLTLPAHAQTRATNCDPATPNNAVCLEWTAPIVHTDGSPIVLPISYRTERQTLTSPPTWVAIETTSLRRSYVKNLAPGTYTFRVVAIVGGAESAPALSTPKTLTQPPPNPPTNILVVEVVIGMDHAPVYRLTQAGKRDARYADACGYIEVGKRCEGPVVYRFRGASFRRVAAEDVKEWGVSCGDYVVAPCA